MPLGYEFGRLADGHWGSVVLVLRRPAGLARSCAEGGHGEQRPGGDDGGAR